VNKDVGLYIIQCVDDDEVSGGGGGGGNGGGDCMCDVNVTGYFMENYAVSSA